ncbi:hypothetical protein BH10BAC5_BH10BAC5_09320 [soil metagenome]
MKKSTFLILFFLILSSSCFSQPRYKETFESTTPGTLPAGWRVVNKSGFNLKYRANWMVRDTSEIIPFISPFTKPKAKSGRHSISVTYYASYDSTAFHFGLANTWLFSPKYTLQTGDSLGFYATGNYNVSIDSLQIWVSTTDTAISSFNKKLGTIRWPLGSPYGIFNNYKFSLAAYIPGSIYVGFRYYMDCTNGDGYFVQLDDIALGTAVGINQISGNLPEKYSLSQNYPNPFNPTTKINFQLPINSSYNINVYDMLGKNIYTFSEKNKAAGTYELELDMKNFSSGIYFYTLQAESYSNTKKMMLIK